MTAEEGKEYADKLGLIFKEVSAKENTNIQDLFDTIIDQLPTSEIYKTQLEKEKEKKVSRLGRKEETEAGYLDSCSGSC